MDWSEWAEAIFGTPYEIWHDGLADERFDDLDESQRATAIALIPEGLAAGDHVAAVAARRLGAVEVLPNLMEALPGSSGILLREVARAVTTLGGDADAALDRVLDGLANELIWLHRKDLVNGLRHFEGPRVVGALLAAVEHDPDYLVRYHAAESLLALAGIDSPQLVDYRKLFSDVAADAPERHGTAARRLQDMVERRSSAEGQ